MLLAELKRFARAVFHWLLVLFGLSAFFFVPVFSDSSVASIAFKILARDLLPNGVQFLVTDPFSAFFALVITSFALAFVVSFPFLIIGTVRYISPALRPAEKKNIFKVIIPTTLLFLSGCVFAYYLIIPLTFRLLYNFAAEIGAQQFFLINEFIYSIFGLMVVTGITFLLPVFMTVLTLLGIVERGFWTQRWRYALVVFLVISAVVTPDGTGITMVLFTLPLAALYILGCIISGRKLTK